MSGASACCALTLPGPRTHLSQKERISSSSHLPNPITVLI